MNKTATTPYELLLQVGKRPKQYGLIARRRSWFDEGGATDEGAPEPGAERDAGGQDWDALPEWARTEYESLRDQLSRVNDESAGRRIQLKDMQSQMDALKADLNNRLTEAEKAKRLQEQVEHLSQYQKTAEELAAKLDAVNRQRLAQIPEHLKVAVPDKYLSPQQLADYLDEAFPALTKPQAPTPEGGSGYSGGMRDNPAEGLTAEELEIARATGVTPEDYAKYKARTQRDG